MSSSISVFSFPYQANQTPTTHTPSREACYPIVGRVFPLRYSSFRLIKDGRVAITAVVHVDNIFAIVQKERCERLCVDVHRTITVKKVGEIEAVRRTLLLEGSQKGYSNDIPTDFR